MTGDVYWRWPGLREAAIKTSSTVLWALAESGLSDAEINSVDLLEVGCGGGAVTPNLAPSLRSVHSIDVSTSMLLAFSRVLPPSLPNITYSLHSLSPSSPETFAARTPQPSPTEDEPARVLVPPRARWGAAAVIMALHHVKDRTGFMRGLIGCMEEGGVLVFIEPGRVVPPSGEHVKLQRREEDGEELDGDALIERMKAGQADSHFLSASQLVELLTEHGLVDVTSATHGSVPIAGVGREEAECIVVWGRKPVGPG